jgi:hypothetical protein
MVAAAKVVVKIAEEEGRPPFRLRGRTVKLTAKEKLTTSGDTTRGFVQGVPVGLWVIRDSGAGPHLIPKKVGKQGRTLAGNLRHPVRTPPQIRHPGASGRGSWKRVEKRAVEAVTEIFKEQVHKVVSQHG